MPVTKHIAKAIKESELTVASKPNNDIIKSDDKAANT